MGKITETERELKKQKLKDFIFESLTQNGTSSVTYRSLAEVLSTRKSTIQGYFPSFHDFYSIKHGAGESILKLILSKITLDDKEIAIQSFQLACEDHSFANCFEVCVSSTLTSGSSEILTSILTNFKRFMEPEDAESVLKEMIGFYILRRAQLSKKPT